MSESESGTWPAGGASLAELERRAALFAAGGRLSIQDQLDWGEALLRDGAAADARPLLASVFIQQGFSRQLSSGRRPLLASAGMGEDGRSPVAHPSAGGNTVELAIAEVRVLARTLGPSIAETMARHPRRRLSSPGLHPTAVLRRAAVSPVERPVAALVDSLFDWLAGSAPEQTDDGTSAIEALIGVEGDSRRFPAAALAAASPALLAGAIAVQELRIFLRTSRDLLSGPLGSARLFHATAALDSAGLGPYFGNVGQIARRSADVFELAAIAEEATNERAIGEEAWVALFSRHLTGGLMTEVLDDLGDRNASFALQIVLERALAVPAAEIDRALVMRIRDAALDNLDYDLAASAQLALVALKPDDMLELRILGVIDASRGYVAAAAKSLETCLMHAPEDQELRIQIEANRLGRFAPFALGKGFGSPRDRQLTRLRRRQAVAA